MFRVVNEIRVTGLNASKTLVRGFYDYIRDKKKILQFTKFSKKCE